jgi:hypothetical protein
MAWVPWVAESGTSWRCRRSRLRVQPAGRQVGRAGNVAYAATPDSQSDSRGNPIETEGAAAALRFNDAYSCGDSTAIRPFVRTGVDVAQTGKAVSVGDEGRLLAIYLNDHLAGATLGLELVRRAARENAGSLVGTFLEEELLPEIVQDRETLQRLMRQLGVASARPKIAAAWVAEKLGRLKLNGSLRQYSPLSRLLELEGLAVGIEGKRALWLALDASSAVDASAAGFDFPALAERAASQRSRLEKHRLAAASDALGEGAR